MISRFAALVEHRRLALLLLAAGYVAAAAASARADTRDGFELSWKAPAGCPSEREVYARIRSLLGDITVSNGSISVEATVTRGRRGELHLELRVESASVSGTRALDGSACDDLAGATAVNVVLLLHSFEAPPSAAEAQATGEPPATGVSQSAPANLPSAPAPANDSAPTEARTWHVLLRAPLIGASFGLLPRPAPGAGVQAGIEVQRWALLLGAALWLPQTLTAPNAASAEAIVARLEGGLRACRTTLKGIVELAPCAGLSMQHVWARGAGPRVVPEAASATWLAPALGLQARAQLFERVALTAHLDVAWQTARARVVIDGLGRLEPLGAADVGFWFGTEWIL